MFLIVTRIYWQHMGNIYVFLLNIALDIPLKKEWL